MKFEIEISTEEIRNSLEECARMAIAQQSNNWHAQEYIKTKVKEIWKTTVNQMIQEALDNSESIREKINAAIERKLKAQLAQVMKAANTQ